jgi:hypothetical protein
MSFLATCAFAVVVPATTGVATIIWGVASSDADSLSGVPGSVGDVLATALQVGGVIGRFGKQYPDILPRISRQLLKAFLDPAKSLGTHYGERMTREHVPAKV